MAVEMGRHSFGLLHFLEEMGNLDCYVVECADSSHLCFLGLPVLCSDRKKSKKNSEYESVVHRCVTIVLIREMKGSRRGTREVGFLLSSYQSDYIVRRSKVRRMG